MALPPVNPHLPSATQIKTHPILPREDCELLRFRQFECDVMPDYKATCYSVWREFLRCPGQPNVEITEAREARVGGWKSRRDANATSSSIDE